jgi:hypothetical protein
MYCEWKNLKWKVGIIVGKGRNEWYVERVENEDIFDGER